jgi:hypothetical protein
MRDGSRSIRIAVALDSEGYWSARGRADADDEEVAQAAADELAEVAETYVLELKLPSGDASTPDPIAIA